MDLAEPNELYQDIARCIANFRLALERSNRICVCGLLVAEYDDQPATVKSETTGFADNLLWLG